MDEIERSLSRMEGEEPPSGLAEKIRGNFHRRHRKYRVVQFALSAAMVLTGAWLFAPWIMQIAEQIVLPQNGFILLPLLAEYLNPGVALDSFTQNATLIQSSLSSTIQLPHWLGIVSLTTGSLLGLGGLLHGKIV